MVDLAKLRADELRAVRSAMANAEHDAGDVDDVPPRIEDDEDAYWAYCTYRGLRRLLAIAEAVERAPVGKVLDNSGFTVVDTGWERAPEIGQLVRLLAIGEGG